MTVLSKYFTCLPLKYFPSIQIEVIDFGQSLDGDFFFFFYITFLSVLVNLIVNINISYFCNGTPILQIVLGKQTYRSSNMALNSNLAPSSSSSSSLIIYQGLLNTLL